MNAGPPDPQWPRLLSLSVHEFRTPVTVVAGYIRMLLKDRAGALTAQQRRLLEEAEKSCGRLSSLLAEMSDLSNLEAGTAAFNRSSVDLTPLLNDAIAGLPELPERAIDVELSVDGDDPGTAVQGDPARLRTAFTSVLAAVRRELLANDRLLVRLRRRQHDGRAVWWIAIAGADQIDAVQQAGPESLRPFDEWRGGCGLSLAIARRVFAAHGGAIWSSHQDTSGAVVMLPAP